MWSMLKINFIISDVNVFRNVKKVTVHVLFMPLLQYRPPLPPFESLRAGL